MGSSESSKEATEIAQVRDDGGNIGQGFTF